MVPGPNETIPPCQVRMIFGIPWVAYINPVMNKAATPQGKKGVPFLIAVDVHGLPGAFTAMPPAIDPYMSQWTSVSGILLYTDVVSTRTSGWRWRLLVNPHSANLLPQSLHALNARFPGGGEIAYSLADEELKPQSA